MNTEIKLELFKLAADLAKCHNQRFSPALNEALALDESQPEPIETVFWRIYRDLLKELGEPAR